MAKVELITAGEQKFSNLREFESAYIKKISRYIKFSVSSIRIKNLKDERKLVKSEGEKILSNIKKSDFLVILDKDGEEMSSIKFAEFISRTTMEKNKRVVFVIGSAAGISEELRSRADRSLSFSKMTFAHDIFKILFLEQLYRAYTIIKGQKYHR